MSITSIQRELQMNLTSHVNGGDESLSSWMYQTKDEKEKKVTIWSHSSLSTYVRLAFSHYTHYGTHSLLNPQAGLGEQSVT